MNIGYFGDGPWAHKAFDALIKDDTLVIKFVCARFSNPDKFLYKMSAKYNIPFFCEKDINSASFLSDIEKYDVDLFVSMSFNQIFKRKLFQYPKLGSINCHAGKLPFYRGRNVLNWVLINGESSFGVTVHYIDEGIDTGRIISQSIHEITDHDDYSSLLKRAYVACSDLLYHSIKKIQLGRIATVEQSSIDIEGSYCRRRGAGDEFINWSSTSRVIFNFVRAICTPGPQATTIVNAVSIKINKVELVEASEEFHVPAGTVVMCDQNTFFVKTDDSVIRVTEWSSIIPIKVGDRFL